MAVDRGRSSAHRVSHFRSRAHEKASCSCSENLLLSENVKRPREALSARTKFCSFSGVGKERGVAIDLSRRWVREGVSNVN